MTPSASGADLAKRLREFDEKAQPQEADIRFSRTFIREIVAALEASSPTIDSKTQIHEGNIELWVFSCWTAKLLLRAKVDAAKIDPHGKFISIDIDDDETAKPEFASSPTIDRAGLVKAVEAEAKRLGMKRDMGTQLRGGADEGVHEIIFQVECLSCGDKWKSKSVEGLDLWMQEHKKGDR